MGRAGNVEGESARREAQGCVDRDNARPGGTHRVQDLRVARQRSGSGREPRPEPAESGPPAGAPRQGEPDAAPSPGRHASDEPVGRKSSALGAARKLYRARRLVEPMAEGNVERTLVLVKPDG